MQDSHGLRSKRKSRSAENLVPLFTDGLPRLSGLSCHGWSSLAWPAPTNWISTRWRQEWKPKLSPSELNYSALFSLELGLEIPSPTTTYLEPIWRIPIQRRNTL